MVKIYMTKFTLLTLLCCLKLPYSAHLTVSLYLLFDYLIDHKFLEGKDCLFVTLSYLQIICALFTSK